MSVWKMKLNKIETMIKSELLNQNHLIEVIFPLDEKIKQWLLEEDYISIDRYFLEIEKPGGALFNFLKNYLNFSSIEHIISIRKPPHDEDGIWHDDGSRILGFTLSLTLDHQSVQGGELRFKNKSILDFQSLSLRPYGHMLLFKTGIYGFEHMVTQVTQGERILIAGWCS